MNLIGPAGISASSMAHCPARRRRCVVRGTPRIGNPRGTLALRRRVAGPMLGPMPTDNGVMPENGNLGRDYGEVLWRPGRELIERSRITGYRRWLASSRGVWLPSGPE